MATEMNAEQRKMALESYTPSEHLIPVKGGVLYYPAAWRLYELHLRYTNANFKSEIIHLDVEKNLVIVKAWLFLGKDYESSEKKAEAFKQGKLSELDKVETAAKARCARDFGIGTEYALDMTPNETDAVHITTTTNTPKTTQAPKPQQPKQQPKQEAPKQEPQQPPKQLPQRANDPVKVRLNTLYERARALQLLSEANAKGFLIFAGSVLDTTISHQSQLTPSRLDALEEYLRSKDAA